MVEAGCLARGLANHSAWQYGRMAGSAVRRERDAALQLVIACLRPIESAATDGVAALLARTTSHAVLAAADHHAVAGSVYARLRDHPDASSNLTEPLRERYEAALRHHLHIVWELARVRPVLQASGTRWAVLKGPMLAELVYESPGERSYGDLDLIVEPARFRQVVDGLMDSGSRLLDRNWRLLRREMRGQLHVALPGGSLLDLHWDLVNLYRGRLRLDTVAALARAEQVDLGGVEAPTLDPTDTLIQVALHGTLSGGDRLRWMLDVSQVIRRRPPDWAEVLARSAAWNASAPVGYLLKRARDVLGADVPDGLTRRLLGRQYSLLVRAADRVSPWQTANGRLTSPTLAIARSMGYGLPGAAAWLVRRGVRSLDPRGSAASSSFAEAGDRDDYEAFMEAIVTGTPRR
jgi:Uncharacterised nucleotidyltransferase